MLVTLTCVACWICTNAAWLQVEPEPHRPRHPLQWWPEAQQLHLDFFRAISAMRLTTPSRPSNPTRAMHVWDQCTHRWNAIGWAM